MVDYYSCDVEICLVSPSVTFAHRIIGITSIQRVPTYCGLTAYTALVLDNNLIISAFIRSQLTTGALLVVSDQVAGYFSMMLPTFKNNNLYIKLLKCLKCIYSFAEKNLILY